MIKANVISGYSNWEKIIKKPNDYLKKRLKILSKAPLFKKKKRSEIQKSTVKKALQLILDIFKSLHMSSA